jgi:hypothetical protein
MSINTQRVTVTTSPTELTATQPDFRIAARRDRTGSYAAQVLIESSADLYIGGSNVTTANGFLVTADTPVSFELFAGDRLYGVVATGTATVSVLQSGL